MPFPARLLVFCLTWLVACASGARGADDLAARVDAFVREEMARQKVPGVSVAILQHGEVALAKGYGLANVEHDVPVTPETIFQSGSVGKQFTSTLVMLLVEDRKLALSDPLAKFFPGTPPEWRAITLRHLLTHTSGIPDYENDKFDLQKNYTVDDLLKFAFGLKLAFEPGQRWSYSNTGYMLLGFVIEKVTGRPYGELLRERVFGPTDMKTTRIISDTDLVPHRAAGYQLAKGELKNQDWVSPLLNTTADGCLYLSLVDFIAWEKAWRTRAVLKPESWAQLLAPVRLNSGRPYPYGFGIFVDTVRGQRIEQHGGAWQGFKAYRAFYPDEDFSVLVLANLAQANPVRFGDGLAALVSPRLAGPDAPLANADPALIARARRLVEETAAGKLSPAECAPTLDFFPDRAQALRDRVAALGAPLAVQLIERKELGDDIHYRFDVTYAAKTVRFILDVGPDGKFTAFNLTPQ